MNYKTETEAKMPITSFNGAVISLTNTPKAPDIIPATIGLLSIPTIKKLPILKPETQLIYVPNEWIQIRRLVRAVVLLTYAHHPSLSNKYIMMSVLNKDEAIYSNTEVSAVAADSNIVHINTKLEAFTPHRTHNLLLTWHDDYSQAETVNRMI